MENLFVLFGVWVVWGIAMYSAVRRIQNQLDPHNRPTIWTYVNELGGYIFVGLLLLAWCFVTLFKILF